MSILANLLIAIISGGAALSAMAAEKPRIKGIRGADDRQLILADEPVWRAVGRVNSRTGGYCTGTLIGPKTVLTAAHCLWNKNTRKWLPAQSLHFVAGYRLGEYVAESRVASFRIADGFEYSGRKTYKSTGKQNLDWALLTLARDVSPVTGFIPLATPPFDGFDTLIQAGYSQDKPHVLTVHAGCKRLKTITKYRMIKHDCDVVKGDSGSPLLVRQNGRLAVMAIHVASSYRKGDGEGFAILAPFK